MSLSASRSRERRVLAGRGPWGVAAVGGQSSRPVQLMRVVSVSLIARVTLVSLVTLLTAASACTVAPEPPPTPLAVVKLSERYEQPTASLDQVTAGKLFEQPVPKYATLKALAGLSFVRRVVARAMAAPESVEGAGQDLDVQGTICVHAPCPGWDSTPSADETQTGYVELTIGIDDSRVQRAFSGEARDCRFVASLAGERAKVQASMKLEVDIGHSLGLGEQVPPLLVRVSALTAALSTKLPAVLSSGLEATLSEALAPDGVTLALDSAGTPVSLRIGGEDLIETLLELDPNPIDTTSGGTVLLGLRDDGSASVRGRDSTWDCRSDGSVLCVRSD